MVFEKFRKAMRKEEPDSEEFIEIDLDKQSNQSKVVIKTFTLKTYEDINPILNALRGGYTIAVVDIRHLKSRDVVELKRSISKIKKTVEALDGHIAGFGEHTVIATPSPVFEIQKGSQEPEKDSRGIERF